MDYINSLSCLALARKRPEAFTRSRSMPLPLLILNLLNLVSKTTTVELNNFFTKLIKKKPVSKQAFSFARGELNYQIFIELNKCFLRDYYVEDYKLYKDYLILAIDGTGIELPVSKELVEEFGCPSNQNGESNKPVSNASLLVDINNKILINGLFESYTTSEKVMALDQIEFINLIKEITGKKVILLCDRGYTSMEFITKLEENNIDYIIRSKKSYIKHTLNASRFKAYDKIRTVKINKAMVKGKDEFKERAFEMNNQISLRFVTGLLKDNEVGVFITSLNKEDFERDEVVQLYRRRWEIETEIGYVKNRAQFENFACKTTARIKQEFYSKIVALNHSQVLIEAAQYKLDKKVKEGKVKSRYKLKINRNVALGLIKDTLPIFITQARRKDFDDEEFLDLITDRISEFYVHVKPNRLYDRKESIRKQKFKINQRQAY